MAEGPLFSLRLTDHDFFMAAPEPSSSGECRKPRNKNTHYLLRLQVHLLACMQYKSRAAGNPWADSESPHHPAWPMHTHHCCPCKESRISLALSIAALPLKTTIAFCQSCGFNTRFCYSQGFQVALRSRAAVALCQMGICVLVCVHSWELLCRSQIHLLFRCALTLPSQVTDAILSKRPWDCNN